MVKQDSVCVKMHGRTVGTLSYDPSGNCYNFCYHRQWLEYGVEISPIWLPLDERTYTFPKLPEATFKGLPGVFADSLPDDFGSAVTEAWLKRGGKGKSALSPLQRLQLTGSRAMGALEYVPELEPAKGCDRVQLASLVETAQWVLDERSQSEQNIPPVSNEALATLLQVATSAGGARPKAIVGIDSKHTELRGGQSDLPAGFEHYLLKFDGIVERSDSRETFGDPQGYGRMEYAYYLMAAAAGVEISPCSLLADGERAHFLTKRFDRIGNQKRHCLSLCALDHADFQLPGSYSYERLFAVARALKLSDGEILQLYRRMVFNVVARNHDDHTKNFGFLLNQHNRWQLAPAYDVAFSYRPGSKFVSVHQMSLNQKREDFSRADLLALAQDFPLQANQIIDEVVEAVAHWPQYVKDADVFADFARDIQAGHRLYLSQ